MSFRWAPEAAVCRSPCAHLFICYRSHSLDGRTAHPGKRSNRLTGKDARERRKQMVSLRRRGFTLAEIGDSFGVSGSRVSQILSQR